MKYTKPPLTISEQIQLLQNRGLAISDISRAEKYLSSISYYRLSGYMYPYKDLKTSKFVSKITFDEILDLYLFDRELRLLVFDAIERIEIAFRTQMIYQPSIKGGAFWFEDSANFNDRIWMGEHLEQLDKEIDRSSEVFIKHFFDKYDEEKTPPAWMAFEVLSFGLLSKFYQNMRISLKAKKEIANHFGISHPKVFQSWIRSITYVRNVCAHHSRLWNRVLTNSPAYLQSPSRLWISAPMPANDKMYYFLCCLLYMLRGINPDTKFVEKLESLFAKYPSVQKNAMGFSKDWENEDFWQ